MKRVFLITLLAVSLLATPALAVNSVTVTSMSVAKGETGVVIPVKLSNDEAVRQLNVPLILREQTPGAFVTSLKMEYAERLAVFGTLTGIIFINHHADEDGTCKGGQPGGFGTVTNTNHGGLSVGPVAVIASPEGVLFSRGRVTDSNLGAGSDATGSIILTADVTSVDGAFEIDTTCTNPANHLLMVRDVGTAMDVEFTKGVITIGEGPANSPPVASCKPVTLSAGENCDADTTDEAFDDGSSDPDGDDLTFAVDPDGPWGVGETAVKLIVTDPSGAADTCETTVTVVDNTPPTVTCPGAESVQCAADIPAVDVNDVTYSDNCPGGAVTHVSDVISDSTCPNHFTITRTYRGTDDAGNHTDCTQTITIDDNTVPTLTCEPDTVQCVADVPPVDVNDVTASDNCGGTVEVTHISDSELSPDSCGGKIIRTYRGVDECGNEAFCEQEIVVDDTTRPAIVSCPGDMTVDCEADIPAADDGLVVATDNCGGEVTITHSTGSLVGGSCGGTVERTYRATDPCGNFTECTQTFTVDDNTLPEITCSEGDTVSCREEVPLPNTDLATATDNCGSATVTHVSRTDNGGAGTPSDPLIYTDTYRATDACGNTDECSRIIAVIDDEPPVAQCPGNMVVNVGVGTEDTVVTFESTVTDNCEGATIACNPPSGSTFPEGQPTEVTCIATDASGNKDTCKFTITVTAQVLPPVALCTDITVAADANCMGNGSIDNGSYDPDGGTVTLSQEPPGPFGLGAHLVKLTVTDDENPPDTDTCSAWIIVVDSTPPTITACPADDSVECLDLVPGATPDQVEASDFCDEALSKTWVKDDTTAGGCRTIITRTYRATDAAGNYDECTQTIVVHDVTPPELICPDQVTGKGSSIVLAYECIDSLPPPDIGLLTVSDNCTAVQDIILEHVGDALIEGTACDGMVRRTYQATDECGNSGECWQDFLILDESPPTITECPAGEEVECTDDIPAPDVSLVNGTDCNGVTVAYVEDVVLDDSPCNGLVERKYSVTDDCGNADTCRQQFTINDQTAPVVTCPENIDVTVAVEDDGITLDEGDLGAFSADDNCDDNVEYWFEPALPFFFPVGKTTVTMYAQDDCGNQSDCTFDVTVGQLEREAVFWATDSCGFLGDTVIVCVNYCINFEAQSMHLGVKYDNTLLTALGVSFEKSAVQQYDTSGTIGAGTICLDAFAEPALIDSGCGNFAVLYFEIIADECPDTEVEVIIDSNTVDGCEPLFTDALGRPVYPDYEAGHVCAWCGCTICGEVVNESGTPVRSALVQAWDSYPGGSVVWSDVTGIDGHYCLGRLDEGVGYDLRIVHADYCTKIISGVECQPDEDFPIALEAFPFNETRPDGAYLCDWQSTNATYQGYPLLEGDVIRAEVNGLVVGKAIVETPGQFFITVYGDYPTDDDEINGAVSGDVVTLFLNCDCPLAAPGTWEPYGSYVFDADFNCTKTTASIPLCDEWTLFSIDVEPPDQDLTKALISIDGQYDYLMSASCGPNGGNKTWQKGRPLNSLLKMDPRYGYWLLPSGPGIGPLEVEGIKLDVDLPLYLCEGWNVIPYYPDEPDDLFDALSSIDGKFSYIFGVDCDEFYSWYSGWPDMLNTLHCLQPGLAYWIYMDEPGVLQYPTGLYECDGDASLSASASLSGNVRVTPRVSEFWSDADPSLTGLRQGDRVTARTQSGVICGEATVNAEGMFLLPVFGDDPLSVAVDGAEEGEELVFEVNGTVARVQSGSPAWHERQPSQITILSAGASQVPNSYSLLQNYPNPFNPSTTISFRMPEASKVTLTIYNVLGQPVRTVFSGELPAGSHSMVWDGQYDNGAVAQSGIYFYRLQAPGWTDAKKMTLLK
jgi:hypothetical protein